MKRKSLITVILLLLLALLLAAAVTAGVIYFRSSRYSEAALTEGMQVMQETLGKRFTLQIKCFVPWGQSLNDSKFTVSEGFVQAGPITVAKSRNMLRGEEKLITIPLTAYRTGTLEPGELIVEVERPFFKNGTAKKYMQKNFKAIEVMPRKIADNAELPLADEVKPPTVSSNSKWLLYTAAIIRLILLAAVIILLKLRRKTQKKIPCWIQSQQELADLRQQISNHQLPLAAGVARLTDIVRSYLSKRFNWRTTRQTSEEFFTTLKQQHLLTVQQTEYLTEFITSADLVKFANLKPGLDGFSAACDKAENLIRETTPANNKNTNSQPEEKQS